MRVVTHRPIQELDLAAGVLQFIHDNHLLDVVPREAIRFGDQHPIEFTRPHRVAQPIQPWPVEVTATAAIITKDMVVPHQPMLVGGIRPQPGQLLLNRLCLGLMERRDAGIDCYSQSHDPPPVRLGSWSFPAPLSLAASTAEGADRPDPNGVDRREVSWSAAESATGAVS